MYYNGEDVLKKRLEIRDNIAKSLGIEGGYDEIEKARNVGDIHPNGKLVWTEYKPGKFDWRKNKGAGKKTTAPAAKGPGKKSSNKNRGSKTAGSVPSELKTGDILIDFDIEGRVESVTRVTQTGRSKDGKLKGFNAENKRTKDTSNFQGYTINKDGTLSDGADYGEDSMKTMVFHPNTDYRDVINASRKKLGMKPLTNLKPLTEKDLLKELGEDGEGQRKASKSKKENKPKYTSSIHSYLNNPKFDLSSDQKIVVSNLNEVLKPFMGINESNISLSDIQRAMGWNKNKTHDIVEALVSKEVLEKKVVPAMDGKDYTTYHFKDQENMVYEPSPEGESRKKPDSDKMNETIDEVNDILHNLETVILTASIKNKLMDDDSEGAKLLKLVQNKLLEINKERINL